MCCSVIPVYRAGHHQYHHTLVLPIHDMAHQNEQLPRLIRIRLDGLVVPRGQAFLPTNSQALLPIPDDIHIPTRRHPRSDKQRPGLKRFSGTIPIMQRNHHPVLNLAILVRLAEDVLRALFEISPFCPCLAVLDQYPGAPWTVLWIHPTDPLGIGAALRPPLEIQRVKPCPMGVQVGMVQAQS